MDGISIIDGKDKNRTQILYQVFLQMSLVSFDNVIVGHDYLLDSDSRFEFYHRVEERIPFDLEFFNKITKGGLPTKTLNIIIMELVLVNHCLCVIWYKLFISR